MCTYWTDRRYCMPVNTVIGVIYIHLNCNINLILRVFHKKLTARVPTARLVDKRWFLEYASMQFKECLRKLLWHSGKQMTVDGVCGKPRYLWIFFRCYNYFKTKLEKIIIVIYYSFPLKIELYCWFDSRCRYQGTKTNRHFIVSCLSTFSKI